MRTLKLNKYLLGLPVALFLCIGTAHAEKVVEHECYLSNSTGGYVNLENKITSKPIYMFNWEIEDDYVATIKRPYPIEDRIIERLNGLRHITFKHSYCSNTPIIKKNVIMNDKWELLESPLQPRNDGKFFDLTIISDSQHNIISKEPTVLTHKLFCLETETKDKGTNIYIVPKEGYVPHHTPRENSVNSGYYDEGDSLSKGSSSTSIAFNDDDDADEGDSGSCFIDKNATFWAQEAVQLEKENADKNSSKLPTGSTIVPSAMTQPQSQ